MILKTRLGCDPRWKLFPDKIVREQQKDDPR
jgi:hypothetical protein